MKGGHQAGNQEAIKRPSRGNQEAIHMQSRGNPEAIKRPSRAPRATQRRTPEPPPSIASPVSKGRGPPISRNRRRRGRLGAPDEGGNQTHSEPHREHLRLMRESIIRNQGAPRASPSRPSHLMREAIRRNQGAPRASPSDERGNQTQSRRTESISVATITSAGPSGAHCKLPAVGPSHLMRGAIRHNQGHRT